ncbi:hypothetical protein E2562_014283 [Oryza meyeriana var. granulata]|uniref:Pentatricopeptide repeat-containing protein n=1 Tax=Oryza meyeriana var. granulata TaxID=110450 RepID=A0A6G1C790_9ORYZ|nr:hypothetical protein E2562_014283 [Oryza meyeriana var. granulata]
MSIPPNAVIWGSLLASCRVHGNISIGIQAAEHRLKLEPGCAATHIQLANLYAAIGCWSDVARVRMAMKERGLKTNIGCSWIEVVAKPPWGPGWALHPIGNPPPPCRLALALEEINIEKSGFT